MTKRERLTQKMQQNFDKIEALEKANIELQKELFLLCDKEQWYTEKEETKTISHRPKRYETALVGRINWNDDFIDEDSGEVITIDRSQVVRINGAWL